MKYCYSNFGMSFRIVADDYTAASGEILFSATPTAAQLKSAFPSTAGARTSTITTNAVATDTITAGSVTLTAATDFTVGSAIADTATNIAAALSANSSFHKAYTAAASGAVITITERLSGNGNTPAAITYTGTIVIADGTKTESVRGHETVSKLENMAKAYAAYDSELQQKIRGYGIATLKGISTSAYSTDFALVEAWYNEKVEAILNE